MKGRHTAKQTLTLATAEQEKEHAYQEEIHNSLADSISALQTLANRKIVATVSEELRNRNSLVPMHATKRVQAIVEKQRPFWEKQIAHVVEMKRSLSGDNMLLH